MHGHGTQIACGANDSTGHEEYQQEQAINDDRQLDPILHTIVLQMIPRVFYRGWSEFIHPDNLPSRSLETVVADKMAFGDGVKIRKH